MIASNKKHFLIAAVLSLAIVFCELAAAQTPARIAWIGPGSAERQGHYIEMFKEGMTENGLVEGTHYVMDVQHANGQYERFPAMIASALKRKPSVIVVVTIASVKAAQQATKTVPIVFVSTNDPVGAGLVSNLPRPGGNTTGISNQAEDAVAKYVELVHEALPKAKRIAALMNPGNASNPRLYLHVRNAAARHSITVDVFKASTPGALDPAFDAIAKHRPDALLVLSDAMLFEYRQRIVDFALRERLPTVSPQPEQAESGMLFAYGTPRPLIYRRAAVYVKQILAGANPGDLPVEQPTQFELAINMKTARAIGVAIPQAILLRADKLFE